MGACNCCKVGSIEQGLCHPLLMNVRSLGSRARYSWGVVNMQGYFYWGAEGILPPLNFDNPESSKIWYVTWCN